MVLKSHDFVLPFYRYVKHCWKEITEGINLYDLILKSNPHNLPTVARFKFTPPIILLMTANIINFKEQKKNMENKRIITKFFVTTLALVLLVTVLFASSVAAASPGDIVINEIMQNPNAVFDSAGEWF